MVASTAVIRHRVPLSPPDRKSVVNGSMTWDGAHGQASGLGERLLTVDDAVGGPVLNRVAPEVAHDGGISGLSPQQNARFPSTNPTQDRRDFHPPARHPLEKCPERICGNPFRMRICFLARSESARSSPSSPHRASTQNTLQNQGR